MMPMMMGSKERLKEEKAIMGLFSLLQNDVNDYVEWRERFKNRAIGLNLFFFIADETMMRKRKGEGEEQYLLQQPVSSGSGPILYTRGLQRDVVSIFADQ